MKVSELLWSWPSLSLVGTVEWKAAGEREVNPGRRRWRGLGATCVQETWLCYSVNPSGLEGRMAQNFPESSAVLAGESASASPLSQHCPASL